MQPCEYTASEARRLIGAGKLSPVDLVESCIAQIEAFNPSVNAVVTKAYDRARAEAKAAESAVRSGKPLGLLHGLPALIKDLNDTEGIRTTYACPLFKDHIPEQDDAIVARMRKQGAIILGKTNTPEFGTGSNTRNRVFGPTGNPFAPKLTCGGSSGGAGVVLAANMAPLANGSDSAASIRNPAAFNGVFGIRPTPGLVPSPRRAIGHTINMVHGPLGRSVDDLALFLASIAAHDNRDMLSYPVDPLTFASLKSVDVSGLRVAVSEDLGFAPVDRVVREIFREKIGFIASSFATCDDFDVNMMHAEEAYWGIRGMDFIGAQKEIYDKHRDELDSNLVSNVEDALKSNGADMAKALVLQTKTYQEFQKVFDSYDILITPAAGVLPFPHEQNYPTVVDNREMQHYAQWLSISYGISLVGHPALSIPAGLDNQGTPFGLQVVGGRRGDHRLLEIGKALESLLSSFPETSRPTVNFDALSASNH